MSGEALADGLGGQEPQVPIDLTPLVIEQHLGGDGPDPSDRQGERSEAGRPPVGVGRGRAAAVAKGPLGPEAAKAVCKRIRDAVKPFAQGSWRGAAARRRARAVPMP